MAGVASRKANRRGVLTGQPARMPATMVTPSLLMPAIRARTWAEPMRTAWG